MQLRGVEVVQVMKADYLPAYIIHREIINSPSNRCVNHTTKRVALESKIAHASAVQCSSKEARVPWVSYEAN